MLNYFNLLKEVYDELDFAGHPERIFNMDETGMPLDPRPPKVVAHKKYLIVARGRNLK